MGLRRVSGDRGHARPGPSRRPAGDDRAADPHRRHRGPRRGRAHRRADRRCARPGRVRRVGSSRSSSARTARPTRPRRSSRSWRRPTRGSGCSPCRAARPDADPGGAVRGGPRRGRRPDRRRDPLRARLPRRPGRGPARPARRVRRPGGSSGATRTRPRPRRRKGCTGATSAGSASSRAGPGCSPPSPGRCLPCGGPPTGPSRRPPRWTTCCRSTSARPAGWSSTSPDAVATDRPISGLREQFRNRTRTATRGIRANLSMVGALAPWRQPGAALAIWSHKLLRWATPWFVLLAAVSGLWLAAWRARPGYLVAPLAVAVGVIAAAVAHLLVGAGRRPSARGRLRPLVRGRQPGVRDWAGSTCSAVARSRSGTGRSGARRVEPARHVERTRLPGGDRGAWCIHWSWRRRDGTRA